MVVRHPCSHANNRPSCNVGGFSDEDDAKAYAEACAQDFKDRGIYDLYFFRVELTTYYG